MAMFRYSSFFFMASVVVVCGLFAGGSMAQITNHLFAGDVLKTGQNISNSEFTLVMQPDCNLVLYSNPSQPVWYTHTNDKGKGCELSLNNDGNLVIRDEDGKLVWESKTNGTVGHYVLLLQRDRNIVIYSKPIWDSGTGTVLTPAYVTN